MLRPVLGAALLVALLAAALASPSSGQGAQPLWEIRDPEGDVRPVHAAPAARAIDIISVALPREDESGFELVVVVSDLVITAHPSRCCPERATFEASFRISGHALTYEAMVWLDGEILPNPSAVLLFSQWGGTLCLRPDVAEERETRITACFDQPLEVWVDGTANSIHVWFARSSLTGTMPPVNSQLTPRERPAVTPAMLGQAERLQDFVVTSSWMPSRVAQPATFWDRAPDEGTAPDYVLRGGPANQALSANIGEGNPVLAVAEARTQEVRVTIANRHAQTWTVNLSYGVSTPPGQAPAVTVEGPSQIRVHSLQVNTFHAFVTSAPGTDPTALTRLWVKGVAATQNETHVAFASAGIVRAPSLDPATGLVYVHAVPRDAFFPVAPGVDGRTMCNVPQNYCANGFLSAAANPPNAAHAELVDGGSSFSGSNPAASIAAASDFPLPNRLVFKRGETMTVELVAVASQTALYDVQVSVHVTRPGGSSRELFREQSSATIGPAGTNVLLEGRPEFSPLEAPVLPQGTRLELRALFAASPASAGTGDWAAGSFGVRGYESRIFFPLDPTGEDAIDAAPATIQMVPTGADEKFINPGRSQLFQVGLLNQGRETAVVELDWEAPEAWVVEFRPGSVFVLDPGDIVTVAAIVFAPPDATEGTLGEIRVLASVAGSTPVQTRLWAMVTNSPVEDEVTGYQPDPAALGKLPGAGGNATPYPGLVALLAASLLACLLWAPRQAIGAGRTD